MAGQVQRWMGQAWLPLLLLLRLPPGWLDLLQMGLAGPQPAWLQDQAAQLRAHRQLLVVLQAELRLTHAQPTELMGWPPAAQREPAWLPGPPAPG